MFARQFRHNAKQFCLDFMLLYNHRFTSYQFLADDSIYSEESDEPTVPELASEAINFATCSAQSSPQLPQW